MWLTIVLIINIIIYGRTFFFCGRNNNQTNLWISLHILLFHYICYYINADITLDSWLTYILIYFIFFIFLVHAVKQVEHYAPAPAYAQYADYNDAYDGQYEGQYDGQYDGQYNGQQYYDAHQQQQLQKHYY